jgi:hypothetical protein
MERIGLRKPASGVLQSFEKVDDNAPLNRSEGRAWLRRKPHPAAPVNVPRGLSLRELKRQNCTNR